MLLQPAPDEAKISPCCQMSLILFFSLLAGTILPSQAVPMTRELRCMCSELSGRIAQRRIAQINIYATGYHCANTEVIATTIEGRSVCLDPKKHWVKVAINRILEKNLRMKQLNGAGQGRYW